MLCKLDDRVVLHVTGEDAKDFLNNILTSDISKMTEKQAKYTLLLGPQGRILHEIFVLQDGSGGYYLDVDKTRKEDLLRRLSIYKLRSKIDMTETDKQVYFSTEEGAVDTRLEGFGCRLITDEEFEAQSVDVYTDHCIQASIPVTAAFRFDKDYPAFLNLDMLNAIDWDKGCFIGQEVVARMHHRGLVKKRLFLIEGKNLIPGETVTSDEEEKGYFDSVLRCVNSDGTKGLALTRIDPTEKVMNGLRSIYRLEDLR